MSPEAQWPFEYEIVPLDRFFVDELYQRPVTSLVDRIARNFRPHLVGIITTSLRKGRRGRANLAVIDGQTRVEGAKRAEQAELPVVIYEGLTRKDEAQIFSDLQSERRNLSSYERFRAQLVAEDPARVVIQAAVKEQGFDTGTQNMADRASKNGSDPIITAVAALERVYAWGAKAPIRDIAVRGDQEGGRLFLEQTLYVLREGFPDREKGYLSGEMIRGMGAYLNRDYSAAQQGLDLDRLIRNLQKRTTVPDLFRRANNFRDARGGAGSTAKYMAEAIHAVNSGGK